MNKSYAELIDTDGNIFFDAYSPPIPLATVRRMVGKNHIP